MSRESVIILPTSTYKPLTARIIDDSGNEICPYNVEYKNGAFEIQPNKTFRKITRESKNGTT